MWVIPVFVVGLFGVGAFCQGAMLALIQVADHGLGYSGTLLVAGLLMVVGAVAMWLAVRMTPAGALGQHH